jgi:hypothetical protein
VLEKDRLEFLALALPLSRLYTLRFFEVDLDLSSLAKLLGVDGIGDTRPELQ